MEGFTNLSHKHTEKYIDVPAIWNTLKKEHSQICALEVSTQGFTVYLSFLYQFFLIGNLIPYKINLSNVYSLTAIGKTFGTDVSFIISWCYIYWLHVFINFILVISNDAIPQSIIYQSCITMYLPLLPKI